MDKHYNKINRLLNKMASGAIELADPEYPDEYVPYFQNIFALKRSGRFDEAIDGYMTYFNSHKIIHVDLLFYFYKTLIPALEFEAGFEALALASSYLTKRAKETQSNNVNAFAFNTIDHMWRFLDGCQTAVNGDTSKLKTYIQSISGSSSIFMANNKSIIDRAKKVIEKNEKADVPVYK